MTDIYRLVYIFFVDGTFRVYKVSQFVKIVFNSDYLASDFVQLVSSGPGKLQKVNITITSNKISFFGIIIFLLQYLFVLSLAGGIISLLLLWKRSKPQTSEGLDIDHVEQVKEDPVEEKLILDNDDDRVDLVYDSPSPLPLMPESYPTMSEGNIDNPPSDDSF